MESIKIGSLNLTPKFSNDVLEYTVNTSNASNKVTVVPLNDEAEIVIEHNGNVVTNGTSVTWADNVNVIRIYVDGLEYVVEVVRG